MTTKLLLTGKSQMIVMCPSLPCPEFGADTRKLCNALRQGRGVAVCIEGREKTLSAIERAIAPAVPED